MFILIVCSITLIIICRIIYTILILNKWIDILGETRIDLLYNDKSDYKKYTLDETINAIYNYNETILHFWKFGLDNLVKNKEIYDFVMEKYNNKKGK